METPDQTLLRKSVKWRTAAGWLLVLILAWRYLVHPISSVIMSASGNPPLPPLDPIAWEDVLAIIGLPVGGAFADSMSKED